MTVANAECQTPFRAEPILKQGRARQPSKSLRREKPSEPARKREPEFETPRPSILNELQLASAIVIARANREAAAAAWNERRRWQQANATELFERHRLQQFRIDLKAWRADPFGMRLVFGSTWHSAAFLSDLWQSVLQAIDSNVGLSYDQIKQVILATGGDWRVDRLDALHGRPMCWFLALHPDAASFLKHWVCDSRARRPGRAAIDIDLDRLRARAFLEAAPAAANARENLRRMAAKEAEIWIARAESLRQAHEQERARCAEVTPPHALGDLSDVRETRRLQRELTTAEARLERLERRMLALCKPARPKAPAATTPLATTRLENARPTTATPAETQQSEITQVMDSQCVVPPLRNGSAGVREVNEGQAQSRRPARRPDAKLLATAWRAKQKGQGTKSK